MATPSPPSRASSSSGKKKKKKEKDRLSVAKPQATPVAATQPSSRKRPAADELPPRSGSGGGGGGGIIEVPKELKVAWSKRIKTTTEHDRKAQDRMFTAIGRSLLALDDGTESEADANTNGNRMDGATVIAKIQQMLKQAEDNERLHLLELAVWKHVCLRDLPATANSVTAVLSWIDQGWKVNKGDREYFRCKDAVTIMDCVSTFLNSKAVAAAEQQPTTTSKAKKDDEKNKEPSKDKKGSKTKPAPAKEPVKEPVKEPASADTSKATAKEPNGDDKMSDAVDVEKDAEKAPDNSDNKADEVEEVGASGNMEV